MDSIEPVDKRARKVYDKYTKAAQALDEGHFPCTLAGPKELVETSILRHAPSTSHPRAHVAAGLDVWRFR